MPSATRSPAIVATAVTMCLAAVFAIDSATGAAPVQHLYYLPIVVAGLGFSWRYAGAAVCVHSNNAFTDSRESATIVNIPRIVSNGTKRHSMQAITSANE